MPPTKLSPHPLLAPSVVLTISYLVFLSDSCWKKRSNFWQNLIPQTLHQSKKVFPMQQTCFEDTCRCSFCTAMRPRRSLASRRPSPFGFSEPSWLSFHSHFIRKRLCEAKIAELHHYVFQACARTSLPSQPFLVKQNLNLEKGFVKVIPTRVLGHQKLAGSPHPHPKPQAKWANSVSNQCHIKSLHLSPWLPVLQWLLHELFQLFGKFASFVAFHAHQQAACFLEPLLQQLVGPENASRRGLSSCHFSGHLFIDMLTAGFTPC